MDSFNIQILSVKKEICSLIQKTLDSGRYKISCTHGDEINEDFIDKFEKPLDCLILDKNIDKEISAKIKEKFSSVPIICLPSLDAELSEANGVKYMSEPFKLSELKKAVDEISAGSVK